MICRSLEPRAAGEDSCEESPGETAQEVGEKAQDDPAEHVRQREMEKGQHYSFTALYTAARPRSPGDCWSVAAFITPHSRRWWISAVTSPCQPGRRRFVLDSKKQKAGRRSLGLKGRGVACPPTSSPFGRGRDRGTGRPVVKPAGPTQSLRARGLTTGLSARAGSVPRPTATR